MTKSRPLSLNCLVFGMDIKHGFQLNISRTKSVSELKDVIKGKNENYFRSVDACDLKLWKVSIALDQRNFDEALKEHDFDEGSLFPLDELSEVFTKPPIKEHLHIVVKPPPSPSQPSPSKFVEPMELMTLGLTTTQLKTAQDDTVSVGQQAPSPSSAAALGRFLRLQERHPIWNGRPSTNRGIPIQLYHPSFAKFLRNIREDTIEVDLKYSATHSLFYSSAMVYSNKAERVDSVKLFLEEAIGHEIFAQCVFDLRSNGACTVYCGGLRALAAETEFKNEIGTGGRDPSHHCATFFHSYYSREEMEPVRNRCCCPTFLIALAGPWMCILGAVFVDHVVIEELTDFIWIGGHHYNDGKIKSVARILAALGTGIEELTQFYTNLTPHSSSQDPQRFYPFIRQYSVEGRVVRFSYQAYLVQKTPESHSKAIFLAITENEDEQEPRRKIVVKFVQRYNAEAHRLLATEGLAPELFYCSTKDPDLAGLTMVVMEYIDGTTAHQRFSNDRLPQHIFDQVEKALRTLHARNFVFGDFRYPNIMITKDDRVRFIDFDWCGVHEEDTYPLSLNDAPDINWHSDVKRGGKMSKLHDTYMLERMRPQSDSPLATTSVSQTRLGKRKARTSDDEGNETV
ncbi:hypothetical protein BJY52DRAFT_1384109 [Lactarius psammicola]|nr:hypothetical protein BJY52DRAFT_1384109 [Lactarius psammicola]